MLPWSPWRCGAGEEQAPEEQDPSISCDSCKAWPSGEGAVGEPGTPPQASPQSLSQRPSRTWREQLSPQPPSGLAAQQAPGTSVPLPPPRAWEVAPPRMTTLLAPWDPNYEAKVGPRLEWGPSWGSGTSFSSRTLCHPSFWPLYGAAAVRGLRPQASATGHQNGEQANRGAEFPVMCSEEVFLSDPLLPCGQHVPLYLSEDPEQVMGSLKLLLPPPIMSPQVHQTPYPGCSTAWLSGPELIALTGLLQMSRGEPRLSSLGAPATPAGAPDPVSDQPSPSGGQSCPYCTYPSLPQTPDTHYP